MTAKEAVERLLKLQAQVVMARAQYHRPGRRLPAAERLAREDAYYEADRELEAFLLELGVDPDCGYA